MYFLFYFLGDALINSAYWVVLHDFLVSADSFHSQLFKIILSGIPSECQTVWIQIRPDKNVAPDLGQNCLQRLVADNTSRQRIKDDYDIKVCWA